MKELTYQESKQVGGGVVIFTPAVIISAAVFVAAYVGYCIDRGGKINVIELAVVGIAGAIFGVNI
jgi:hypothetical protein